MTMERRSANNLMPKKIESDCSFDDLFADLPALDPFEVKKEYLATDLAALLVHSGITRSVACEKLGWHKSALTRVLSGKGNPTVKTIWNLAQLAGYDFDLVFRRPEQQVAPQPWTCLSALTNVENFNNRSFEFFVLKVQTPEQVKSDMRNGTMSSMYFSVDVPEIIEMEFSTPSIVEADQHTDTLLEKTLFIDNATPTTLQSITAEDLQWCIVSQNKL